MNKISTVIVASCIIAGLISVIVIGSNKNEEKECLFWQRQATQYPSFYLTHWQKEQCDAHGIAISAPVR